MKLVLDSFWRAVFYCLHPRVIVWSFVPWVVLAIVGGLLGYFFWTDALDAVRLWLEGSGFLSFLLDGLAFLGLQSLRSAIPPLLVIAIATPVLVILVMVTISSLMVSALTELVAQRRFAALAKTNADRFVFLRSLASMLGVSLVALVLLVVSLPLWVIPPLAVLLPPLIWGWLTSRVMSMDALSTHAGAAEAGALLRQHRVPLVLMGVVVGYLSVMPSLIWAFGALAAVFAVILLPLMIWLYTLIFVFSALWFVHYCLAALAQYRAQQAADVSAGSQGDCPKAQHQGVGDEQPGSALND